MFIAKVFLATCLLDILLCVEQEFSNSQKGRNAQANQKLEDTLDVIDEMAEFDSTSGLTASSETGGKEGFISRARGKIQSWEDRSLGTEDPEGATERITGAMSGFGEGAIGLATAINDGDWIAGVQGALSKFIVLSYFNDNHHLAKVSMRINFDIYVVPN